MTNLRASVIQQIYNGLQEASDKIEIPDPVKWIQKEFYIPETKNDPKLRGRLELQPYQQDALREAFSIDERGLFKYDIIIWSDIKKSIKSTIAAAVNLYRSTFTNWGEFYVVANDLKQANSRVAQYIRRAISLNPKMKNYRAHGYEVSTPSGSVIEAVPIDPTGEAGSNADMITFSELWGANQDAKQRMWAEMTIPPAKHGRAFRWVESYAGFSEESKLLYSLYETGVNNGKLLWPDRKYDVTDGDPTPLELYVNRDARMLCLWNTMPRCPWQTREYYSSEEKLLLPADFRRMHRNQWVSSTDTFVPMEWVFACRRAEEEWPQFDATEFRQSAWPMVIALDAATTNDTFGLLMGCRHPKHPDDVLVQYAQRWKASTVTGKIDFIGTDEKPGPDKVLERLVGGYNIIQVCYDPYQLHDFAMRWKKKNIVWFKEFSQGSERLKADSQLRDVIRDRRLWHRGEPDLIEHLQNANAEIDAQESKMRLVKRTDSLKIDLAVCLSMCCHELLRLNL